MRALFRVLFCSSYGRTALLLFGSVTAATAEDKESKAKQNKKPLFNSMAEYNAIEIYTYKSENDKSLEIQIITLFHIREVCDGQPSRAGVSTCLRS